MWNLLTVCAIGLTVGAGVAAGEEKTVPVGGSDDVDQSSGVIHVIASVVMPK